MSNLKGIFVIQKTTVLEIKLNFNFYNIITSTKTD